MIRIPQNKKESIINDLMPDFTPLLDVMFMMLVFFILTANAVPYSLDVNLPEDSEEITQAVEDPDMLSVTLLAGKDGWKLNDTSYDRYEDFKAALEAEAQENRQVVIIGDKDVSMQKLLDVMVFLRKNKIEAADIIMDRQ